MNIIRYAFKNISRNLFLSLSSILIIGLLIFFVNVLLFVEHASNTFIASVNNKIAFTISFQDGYNDTQVRSQEFLSGITTSFSGVRIDYISRNKALSIFSERNPDLASIIENATDNPLPNSVRISNVPLPMYEAINGYIEQYRDILQYDAENMGKKLVDYESQYNRIQEVVSVLKAANIALYVLVGLFLFTVFIVVHMVIRNFIFFLQDEIRIIELVGGKSTFIYGPFIIQGFLYMFFAVGLVACAFFLFSWSGGIQLIPEMFREMYIDFHARLTQEYFVWEFLISGAIGVFSALLASYKYIHSTIGE